MNKDSILNRNYYILSQANKKSQQNYSETVQKLASSTKQIDHITYSYCVTDSMVLPEDSQFTITDYGEAAGLMSDNNQFLWEMAITYYTDETSQPSKRLATIYGASTEEVYNKVIESESYKNAVASAESA